MKLASFAELPSAAVGRRQIVQAPTSINNRLQIPLSANNARGLPQHQFDLVTIMADSKRMAEAANQPAGKVATDNDTTPFTAVGKPQGEQHFDPDAQKLGPGDPNYIDPDTKGMEVPPPSGMGDAVQAAMNALPTGMAGGVKYADTPQQSGPANANNNPSPNTKIDPGLPGTM